MVKTTSLAQLAKAVAIAQLAKALANSIATIAARLDAVLIAMQVGYNAKNVMEVEKSFVPSAREQATPLMKSAATAVEAVAPTASATPAAVLEDTSRNAIAAKVGEL